MVKRFASRFKVANLNNPQEFGANVGSVVLMSEKHLTKEEIIKVEAQLRQQYRVKEILTFAIYNLIEVNRENLK